MPVLEDGLSDSENISDDERSPPKTTNSNNRHRSTQSDFLSHSNPSHKHQFAKSNNNEPQSQAKSYSNHSQASSSTGRTDHQHKIVSEESSAMPTGRSIYKYQLVKKERFR
jgi:hypothetical protein